MNDFTYYVPTKIYFGKNGHKHLKEIFSNFGKRILFVYGGGSIKSNGLYDKVYEELSDYTIVELHSVNANPRIESVEQGVLLCQEHNIDVILAVGGGSCVDCAKAIAACAKHDGDAWTHLMNPSQIKEALPVVDIITLSATGSEMNATGVISNPKTCEKKSFTHPLLFPYASILDPQTTYSLPSIQTAAGCADTLSHLFEIYFNHTQGAFVQEQLAHSMMKTCFKYGPIALANPSDYEARSNLMWAATLTLNSLVASGFGQGWSCHTMQHVLGAKFDNTHGIGLAILTPAWMSYVLSDETLFRFVQYGIEVCGIDADLEPYDIASKAIEYTRHFFVKILKIPATLSQVGIYEDSFDSLAQMAVDSKGGAIKGVKTLYKQDVLNIYTMCK